MQIAGKPHKVKLIKDLTNYDERLVIGIKGKTIPNIAIGSMGNLDDFTAVEFENGATVDVLFNNLEFLD